MPWQWVEPEELLTYRAVRTFHAYKDELSDVPLEFWYSTSSTAEPGSAYEFDVRDLPGYGSLVGEEEISKHKRVIQSGIDAGLLRVDEPVSNA
jgi:hypothetical protein